MKLKKMRVRNFRGIEDLEFEFQNYSLLIGPNNSGKSTVLNAIRAFYGDVKFDENKDLPKFFNKKDAKESSVELSFELNEIEISSLGPQYIHSNEELKLKKYLIKNGSMDPKEIYYLDKNTNEFVIFMNAKTRGDYIGNLIYIPAISNVEDQTKMTGPSPLRDSILNIVKLVIEKYEEYENLKKQVGDFSKGIKKSPTPDSFSLDTLQKELNDEIKDWNSSFELDFCVPNSDEMVKYFLKWEIFDNAYEDAIDIKNCGSGFQRYLIYKLISIAGKYIACGKQKPKKEQNPQLNLILFEEPEAFLHPPQQLKLARELNKFSKECNWQIICSSHSPHFISRNTDELLSLIKMKKGGYESKIQKFQLTQSQLQNILNKSSFFSESIDKAASGYTNQQFEQDNKDNEFYEEEMASIKYFIWLDYNRSSAFFADKVLLVEGPSEVALIRKLIEEEKLKLNGDIFIMDTLGKYPMPSFMELFSNFGVNHAVLYDDDYPDSYEKSKESRQKIFEKMSKEAEKLISSHKNDYTLNVGYIKNDLETFLDIQKPDRSHRKPQSIMYKYLVRKEIKKEKIKLLCEKITFLLSDEKQPDIISFCDED